MSAAAQPGMRLAGPAWESVRWHKIPLSTRELRQRIELWLRTNRGPSAVPFTSDQEQLLRLLSSHLGQEHAVKLEELARALDGRSDRLVKQLVQDLRLIHRIKVGSLRGYRRQAGGPQTSKLAGYFLCLTPREVDVTIAARLAEVRSSLEVINALKGGLSHALAEVNGQLRLLFGGSPNNG